MAVRGNEAQRIGRPCMTPMMVMIVEDEPDIALWEQVALEYEGVSCKVWGGPFEALLAPGPWVGVTHALVDLNLPGVTGIDVLAWLKANRPEVRRVVCSAISWLREEEMAAAADAVLTKPVTAGEIVAALRGEGTGQ